MVDRHTGRLAFERHNMDDNERRAAFLAALNNHYFVLQSAAGNTISESGSRASLYVLSLSSTLVAIGFVTQSPSAVGPFLAVVLPTLFVLGVFTVVRLVDTGVQNVGYLLSMARIRRYYADLTPEAVPFFGSGRDDLREALATLAVGQTSSLPELFTVASMIAVIDSVVGSTGVALVVAHLSGGFDRAPGLSIGIGVLAGLVLIAGFLVYQHARYQVNVPGAGGPA
jgi:hypothetical protein